MDIMTMSYIGGIFLGKWIGIAVIGMLILFVREIIIKLRKRPHHVNWRGYLDSVSVIAAIAGFADIFANGL